MHMLLSSVSSLPPPAIARRTPAIPRCIKLSTESRHGVPSLASQVSNHPVFLHTESSATPRPLARTLGLRRDPELGLCSLLFVLSMALGSFFSLAVISLPALSAVRRLAVSMDKLSKVVSEEVPGTLSSLKLSGLEINELTSQLSNLRLRITANRHGKKVKSQTPTSRGADTDSIIN